MSRVEVTQETTPLSDGILKTDLPIDGTLQVVKDQLGNSSTLLISNTQTKVNSVLGINNSTFDTSAQLQINSTTKGILIPRMTNAQRAAITSPAAGLQIYNSTNNALAYYDGTSWGYSTGAPQTISGIGGTVNIPFASGNIVELTLIASTILTFTGHVVGTYIFEIIQGGGGSYTITWPASVKWSGGTAPTLSTTVGKTDIVTLFHDGTYFYGTYSLNY